MRLRRLLKCGLLSRTLTFAPCTTATANLHQRAHHPRPVFRGTILSLQSFLFNCALFHRFHLRVRFLKSPSLPTDSPSLWHCAVVPLLSTSLNVLTRTQKNRTNSIIVPLGPSAAIILAVLLFDVSYCHTLWWCSHASALGDASSSGVTLCRRFLRYGKHTATPTCAECPSINTFSQKSHFTLAKRKSNSLQSAQCLSSIHYFSITLSSSVTVNCCCPLIVFPWQLLH